MEVSAKHGRIGGIVETMRNQISSLEEEHRKVLEQAHSYEEEIARLEEAVASLLGKPSVVTTSKRQSAPTRTRTKRKGDTLAAEEIVKKVDAWLGWDGPLTEKELRSRVKEEAAAQGRSAQGAHFVLNRVLKEGDFEESGGKWSKKK